MSYLTLHRCINVHPADLSILNQGKTKVCGGITPCGLPFSPERTLAILTIWTDRGLDTGPLLMFPILSRFTA